MLHDPDEEPLMIERGLKVSPGFLTQIAVTAKYVSELLPVKVSNQIKFNKAEGPRWSLTLPQ